jgi:AsmA protein
MARRFPWLKIVSVLALVAILGVGAATVALKAFFPEPKIRAMIVDAARKQLGREVKLTGIGVGVTGLSLKGLEISERPDFSAGTFLSVDSFSLRPSWRALIQKRLVVASAVANGLKVKVVKAADGKFNYETLAAADAAPSSAPAAKSSDAPPTEFNVRHLRIKRGAVEYRDETSKSAWSVTGLTLALDNFSLSDPFTIDVSLNARGKAGERPVDAAISFTGRVHPERGDLSKIKTEFSHLSVEQDGVKLTAKGTIAHLDAPDATLDLSLSVAGKTLLESAGTVRVSSPAAAGARAVDADLKLNTSGLDTTLLAKLVPMTGIPALKLPAANAELVGRYEGDTASLKTLKLSWPDGKVEASGTARGLEGKTPVYEGQARFGVEIPEIRSGQYSFIALPPKSFVPAMHLDGDVTYGGDELKITSLDATTKQGTFSASGAVRKLSSAKPVPDLVLRFDLNLPAFKVSELPVAVSGPVSTLVVPAARVEGGARIHNDDLTFEKVSIAGKSGTLKLNGTVAKALAGTPEPALELQADLDLPPLTDKDLPFPGVPQGLDLPRSRWAADLSYTPRAVAVRKLDLKLANNELSMEGGVTDPSGRAIFDLTLKCKRFVLEELTKITQVTRDLKMSGSGFFALAITGNNEKPVFSGKLQFKGVGATVADLALADFTGTASFDGKRIDVPNLKGKIADGSLTMDLTVKDYTKIPEIQLEASLDRFDLGKYLAAKTKLAQNAQAAKTPKPAAAEKPTTSMRTRGRLDVGALTHPNATVEKVAATWDLHGLTPDLSKLSGEAILNVGGGKIHAVGDMASQSPIVKILVFPLLIVQKIGKFGGAQVFPDFNNITLQRLTGDYAFRDGVMTVRDSHMDSDAARISAKGTINLPTEALDLVMTAQVANVMPIDVAVKGTVASPKTNVKVAKAAAEAAVNLIENLLKR